MPRFGSFALRRTLRIYPALVVNSLACACILGPLVTALSYSTYFASPGMRSFVGKVLTMNPGPLTLPGVLFVDNPVGLLVNGSLWTLRYEVMMYVMILILGGLRWLNLPASLVLLAAGIAAIPLESALAPLGDIARWAWMLSFFASGMVMYFMRDRLVFKWRYAVVASAALILFAVIGGFIMLFSLPGAYLVIYFATRHHRCLDYSRYVGDLSYGIYIYGWPAEEFVMYLSGGRAAWWQVFLGSVGLTVPLAWLSWHGVEKWALRRARGLGVKRATPDFANAVAPARPTGSVSGR